MYTLSCRDTHKHMHMHTYRFVHRNTHAHTHARMYAHTHTHTLTLGHTHIESHPPAILLLFPIQGWGQWSHSHCFGKMFAAPQSADGPHVTFKAGAPGTAAMEVRDGDSVGCGGQSGPVSGAAMDRLGESREQPRERMTFQSTFLQCNSQLVCHESSQYCLGCGFSVCVCVCVCVCVFIRKQTWWLSCVFDWWFVCRNDETVGGGAWSSNSVFFFNVFLLRLQKTLNVKSVKRGHH